MVAPAELDAAVDARLDALLTAGPQAVRLQKKLIRDWENMTLDQAVRAGIESFKQAYATDEPTRMMARSSKRACGENRPDRSALSGETRRRRNR